ncbi:hypothetical protein EPI10_002206 [Gossypium australe]|uniref:Uncharacterized protein n=1 Tax=Gossypium australe TaxID=47621 RepID=A0A5B6VDA3_9ROSI|nr:hypothetical protein EPI10_002206 [Gossypium australe]
MSATSSLHGILHATYAQIINFTIIHKVELTKSGALNRNRCIFGFLPRQNIFQTRPEHTIKTENLWLAEAPSSSLFSFGLRKFKGPDKWRERFLRKILSDNYS